MDQQLSAIELMGTVDKHRRLKLDEPLPFTVPRRVRVILLFSDAESDAEEDEDR
jgi:hypothetical protein